MLLGLLSAVGHEGDASVAHKSLEERQFHIKQYSLLLPTLEKGQAASTSHLERSSNVQHNLSALTPEINGLMWSNQLQWSFEDWQAFEPFDEGQTQ